MQNNYEDTIKLLRSLKYDMETQEFTLLDSKGKPLTLKLMDVIEQLLITCETMYKELTDLWKAIEDADLNEEVQTMILRRMDK